MDSICVSIGTAAVLGLTEIAMAVAPTTAYLMLGGRCAMNCAFCAQSRSSAAGNQVLSRVTWPSFPLLSVCAALARAEREGCLRRCCIQVTAGRDAYRETLKAVCEIKLATRLPLDIAILPSSIEQIEELIAAGVDHLGFGLDAACERVFHQIKGPHWDRVIEMIAQAAARFPKHVAIHLIVGLGETEREMVERIAWAYEHGIEVGLFAFTPVRGTSLADCPPPPLAQYRRIQAVRWLIIHCQACLADFDFNAQSAVSSMHIQNWPMLLQNGDAFRTSGCPDCNRPFYTERPGGTMYNYPRPLTGAEAAQAIHEMEIGLD